MPVLFIGSELEKTRVDLNGGAHQVPLSHFGFYFTQVFSIAKGHFSLTSCQFNGIRGKERSVSMFRYSIALIHSKERLCLAELGHDHP